jgi:hypothetical protein
MEPCMNQNHNIDIDLFKRKANRIPLSPLTQGIHFLNQLHDMQMLYCYMKFTNAIFFVFKSDSSLTSNKNENFDINIPSKRLKRPDAQSFYPAPNVVNGMNYVALSSNRCIQHSQYQSGEVIIFPTYLNLSNLLLIYYISN